jgi:uncharacterized protein
VKLLLDTNVLVAALAARGTCSDLLEHCVFAETFTLVTPDALDSPTCRDRDDDVVLGSALAGVCAAIVSGDQDLLILDPFRGIRVLAPSAFWQCESTHDEH